MVLISMCYLCLSRQMAAWLGLFFWLLCVCGANASCPSFNINYPPLLNCRGLWQTYTYTLNSSLDKVTIEVQTINDCPSPYNPPFPTLLCSGDSITYTCALNSTLDSVNTLWSGSGVLCPSSGGSPENTISLTQAKNSPLNTVPESCGNLSAVMTNVSGTCYTSVLTIPTPQYFNGITVNCTDGTTGTLIGSDTLNIQLASPPSTPHLLSLSLNPLTVTWISDPTVTSYNVILTGSINTVISIPSYGEKDNSLTIIGLVSDRKAVFTISLVAINCAGSSSPLVIANRTSPLPPPTSGRSSSIPSDILPFAVGIGVGVGVPLLLVLILAVVGVVYFFSKGRRNSGFKISDETTSLVGGSLEKKRNVGVTYSDVKHK